MDEDLEMEEEEEEQGMDSRCVSEACAVGESLGVCLAGSRLKPPCDGEVEDRGS